MKNSILIVLMAFMLACGSKEEQPELISFDELAGETGAEQNQVETVDTGIYDQVPLFRQFVAGQVSQYDTLQLLKAHPLDRFGFSSSARLSFRSRMNTSVAQASVYYYTFSDSLKTKNAFYNWLDCFGNQCEEIQLNKKLDKISADPSFTLVYDTAIVALEWDCEAPKGTWKSFQDSLVTRFGKNYKYRLEVRCNGPAEWK